jgi:hypothetical protein
LYGLRLAIQKRPEGAAVLAVTGEDGSPARIVEVGKDPGDEYPYRLKDLAAELNRRLNPASPLTTGDLQAVVFSGIHGAAREVVDNAGVPSATAARA